tara:strand:+ start:1081 stop:2103 length:1023 start_codon:yes stop_codon:yes gene_type:complete
MNSGVIFGGCGFIGLYFAEKALDINLFDNLYLVDIREPEDSVGKLKFKKLLDTGKVKFLKRDVRENLNDILIEKNLTTILNFAAIHREPGHQAYEYGETNISGAKNVCDFAKFNNCKNIIFTSSIAVYGLGEHEKNESTEAKPSTPYGKSKLESEKVHLIWQKEDPDNRILSICRPGVVFGAGEKGNVTRLVKFIKKRLFFYMNNKDLKKGGLYVKELINMLIWVNKNQMQKKMSNLALFNACMYPCPTIEDFAVNISKKVNHSGKFISMPAFIINFFLFLSLIYTKLFKINNSLNYYRIIKLFRSNTIIPLYLVQNKYHFEYDLKSSFDDWKKIDSSDW